jgi:cell wall-associated NlpC family hydrolase
MIELTHNTTGYGQVRLSVIPIRAQHNHRSEMVTQALFGEMMEIENENEEWLKIKLKADSYEGWVEKYQIATVSEQEYHTFKPTHFSEENRLIELPGGVPVKVFKGSPLPFFEENTIMLSGKRIPYPGNFRTGKHSADEIIETALSFLNTPYLWGGKTEMGMDCSGFTQLVYNMNGYNLLRDASQQVTQGENVAFHTQAQKADLGFFGDEEESITHVGIIMDSQRILHAAKGKVRIDIWDAEGIYNRDLKRYTHHLRLIKRMI